MVVEYRVCARPSVPGQGLMVFEMCLDDKGRIVSYVKTPVIPYGDTVDELYQDYYKIWRAIEDHDVIDLDRLDAKLEILRNSNGRL